MAGSIMKNMECVRLRGLSKKGAGLLSIALMDALNESKIIMIIEGFYLAERAGTLDSCTYAKGSYIDGTVVFSLAGSDNLSLDITCQPQTSNKIMTQTADGNANAGRTMLIANISEPERNLQVNFLKTPFMRAPIAEVLDNSNKKVCEIKNLICRCCVEIKMVKSLQPEEKALLLSLGTKMYYKKYKCHEECIPNVALTNINTRISDELRPVMQRQEITPDNRCPELAQLPNETILRAAGYKEKLIFFEMIDAQTNRVVLTFECEPTYVFRYRQRGTNQFHSLQGAVKVIDRNDRRVLVIFGLLCKDREQTLVRDNQNKFIGCHDLYNFQDPDGQKIFIGVSESKEVTSKSLYPHVVLQYYHWVYNPFATIASEHSSLSIKFCPGSTTAAKALILAAALRTAFSVFALHTFSMPCIDYTYR